MPVPGNCRAIFVCPSRPDGPGPAWFEPRPAVDFALLDDAARPTLPIGNLQPPCLPFADTKEHGRALDGDEARFQPDENLDALFVLRVQDQSAFFHQRT